MLPCFQCASKAFSCISSFVFLSSPDAPPASCLPVGHGQTANVTLADVTLKNLTLLRSLTLLSAPKVYFECDGTDKRIDLPKVTSIDKPFSFADTDSFQVRGHCGEPPGCTEGLP